MGLLDLLWKSYQGMQEERESYDYDDDNSDNEYPDNSRYYSDSRNYDEIHCFTQGHFKSSSGYICEGRIDLVLDKATFNRCSGNRTAMFNIVRMHYPDAIAIHDGFTLLIPK